jgi:hypothetical protein
MSIELSDCVTVRVIPPPLPRVKAVPPPPPSVRVLPVAGPQGPPGPSGSSSDVGQVKASLTASTTLSGHRAVTLQPNGELEYADNTTPSHLHVPIWLTMAAVMSGASVEVLLYGVLTEPSWSWTPDAPLYLGANGIITQTAPTSPALFLAQVGIATGPTTVFIDRQPSILLI